MDDVTHHSKDGEFLPLCHLDRGKVGILRLEKDLPSPLAKALHREVPVDHRDHDLAVGWSQRLVDDENIARMDPGIAHRVPLHTNQESRGGIADQLLVEIDPSLQMIIGGRGKPRLHGGRDQRKPQTRALLKGYRGLDFHAQEYGLGLMAQAEFTGIKGMKEMGVGN